MGLCLVHDMFFSEPISRPDWSSTDGELWHSLSADRSMVWTFSSWKTWLVSDEANSFPAHLEVQRRYPSDKVAAGPARAQKSNLHCITYVINHTHHSDKSRQYSYTSILRLQFSCHYTSFPSTMSSLQFPKENLKSNQGKEDLPLAHYLQPTLQSY